MHVKVKLEEPASHWGSNADGLLRGAISGRKEIIHTVVERHTHSPVNRPNHAERSPRLRECHSKSCYISCNYLFLKWLNSLKLYSWPELRETGWSHGLRKEQELNGFAQSVYGWLYSEYVNYVCFLTTPKLVTTSQGFMLVCVGFISAAGDVLEKKYTTRYFLKRTKCVYIDIDPVVCQHLGNWGKRTKSLPHSEL